MADLMASAGLVVLFSDYEAHPVAVMEALSLRRPVLVRDTSGLRELAEKGLCRAIPASAGPEQAALAMAEELSGHRNIADAPLPDWDTCAKALGEVYRDVAHRSLAWPKHADAPRRPLAMAKRR
jgi:glycosyltransferase involved in cell wall biosynthesis